ncbi:hypothetical protein ABVT39_019772 [Epinephelus coioides]
MKTVQIYLLLYVVSSASVLANSFNPFTEVIADLKNLWKMIYNPRESCDSNWVSFNAEGLEADLGSKLFGQHIASRIILKAVSGFMNDDNPKKPLVLSLHGQTGVGKNFVSKLIAENIYKKGMESSFVYVFTSELHFPHQSKLETYKSQLQQQIKENVTNCARFMFVFDEMDKMHPGLIDSIKPYLGYHSKLDGVSYRKAMFIFLSNAGGTSITQTALDFWKGGRNREEIELKDLETLLSVSVFNTNYGGLWHSSLIDKNLVDFFVPFLPLEYQQVIQCVMAEMKARGLRPDLALADRVARDLEYFPKDEGVFSVRGCKTICRRLHYYIMSVEG